MQSVPTHLRPMGLGDILDAVFRLYRSNFLTFIGIVALLQVPMILLQISLTLALNRGVTADIQQLTSGLLNFDPRFDSLAELPIGNLILFGTVTVLIALFQGLVIQQLITGALANAVARRYQNQPVAMLEAYDFGIDRMLALIGAGLIMGLIVTLIFGILSGFFVGGIVLLGAASAQSEASGALFAIFAFLGLMFAFIAALLVVAFVAVRFLFFTQAVVLEGHGPLSALRRSWQLVSGSFWRVLGAVALIYILVQILVAVPGMLFGGAIGIIFNDPLRDFAIRQSLSTLVGYSAQILVLPLNLIAYTLIYYDLRIRKEGYDLQLLAQTT